ncbi:hypothetical protein KCU99_g190, partial [Aureobasidium melanogenum]
LIGVRGYPCLRFAIRRRREAEGGLGIHVTLFLKSTYGSSYPADSSMASSPTSSASSSWLSSDVGLVTMRTLLVTHVCDMLVHMLGVTRTRACRKIAASPTATADEIVVFLAADVSLEMLLPLADFAIRHLERKHSILDLSSVQAFVESTLDSFLGVGSTLDASLCGNLCEINL